MSTWDDIRSDWVNGKELAVMKTLQFMYKGDFIKLTLEALNQDARLRTSNSFSGDLADLREILTKLSCYY